MNRSVFYKKINNVEFFDEVKKSQEQDQPTERFMMIVYTIAHKILRQRKFFHTTEDWKEDACSSSLLKCCDVFNKFDLSRNSSAYSFFHTTIKNAIFDCFNHEYYKFFDLKRNLMQFNACESRMIFIMMILIGVKMISIRVNTHQQNN